MFTDTFTTMSKGSKWDKPIAVRLKEYESDRLEKLRARAAKILKVQHVNNTQLFRLMLDYCFEDDLGDFPDRSKMREINSEYIKPSNYDEHQAPLANS